MPTHISSLKDSLGTGQFPPEGTFILYTRNCPTGKGSFFLRENILLFVQEEYVKFHYGDMTCTVRKHQFAFLRKGILLEFESGNPDAVLILIILKNDMITEFISRTQINTGLPKSSEIILTGNPSIHLRIYFESLQLYLDNDGSIPDGLARIKLKELLYCISRNETAIMEQILDTRDQLRPDMTQIIEDKMMDSLSLDQLARLTGRSVSSFRRDFLFIYNMPPSRWIRLRKLDKAKELLANTNMTVTDICYTLGFESIAHFSRIFKSHFGYPPSGSRKNTLSIHFHSEKIHV